MVVVFLDGVDGAGKTTLLHHLVAHLRDRRTVVTPPLWRYLPSIAGPEDFAGWVTTTEPARVAVELLTGQCHRLAEIETATQDVACPIVLADRGPRTVEASACAHLGVLPAAVSINSEVERSVASLHDTVRRLANSVPCLSIALEIRSYDEIIDRLTDDERNDPAYVRYLHRFLDEFRAVRDVDVVTALELPATDSVARNCTAVALAVSESAADRSCHAAHLP